MTVSRPLVRGVLAALAMAALAACASHPKTAPTTAQQQPYSQSDQPARAPSSAVESQQTGPLPGSEQDFVINAGDRVYFDFDQYAIRPDASPVLAAQAAWLQRYRAVRVRIDGNCDDRGTREYNFALGARRAEAVRAYLVAHGIEPGRIETISYGKERPIDPSAGDDAWSKNRNGHTQITGER